MPHLLCALVLAALPLPGAGAADFDQFFNDRTLRVDYFHTGHATEEVIALDRLSLEGVWAGSRKNLIDSFNLGGYYVKVYDPASGKLLFSRGFDSIFGEYKLTGPASRGIRRTYHESALIPCPRQKVRFVLEVRRNDRSLAPLFITEIDPASYSIHRDPPPEGLILVEEQVKGDPHTKVDVAILGEGYTRGEEAKFRADLRRFGAILLAAEPFKSAAESFNLRGVLLPSADSGCDEPSHGIYRRTALGASFDALGSERYLLTEDNRALREAAAAVPYDVLVIMVNQPRYGGGGIYNFFCTFVTDNQWSAYTLVHEFGHLFAGLADEYYTSSTAYNEFYPRGVEPQEPNITALLDPAALKWKDALTPGVQVPTPWEKADFDALDRAYQKVREELNATLARRLREGAPAAEINRLKAESEKKSAEHAAKVDAFLSTSAFAGQVGVFEGAGYAAEGLYRSEVDCIMFTKGSKPFCAACRRGLRRAIAHYAE